MSTYNVTFSGLDALLQSLPANTVDTPYDICITEITAEQCEGDQQAKAGTLQYVLRQNESKYVNLSFSADLSEITNTSYMCSGCYNLISIDCSNFTSVIYPGYMFRNCRNLKFIDASGFCSIEHGLGMFTGCTSLTSFSTREWSSSSITNTQSMFENCTNLEYVSCEGFYRVTNAQAMFKGCENLKYLDNFFDLSLLTELLATLVMFYNVPSSVKIGHFDKTLAESNAKYLYTHNLISQGNVHCYYNCLFYQIKDVNPSEIFFDNTLTVQEWKEGPIMAYNLLNNDIFGLNSTTKSNPIKVNYIVEDNTFSPSWSSMTVGYYLNDSDTSPTNVEYTQGHIPYCDYSETTLPSTVTRLNISGNVSVVKSPILTSSGISNCTSAFLNCTSLTELPELPSTVTSTQNMFKGCTSLTEVDVRLSSNVIYASSMFKECTSLRKATIRSDSTSGATSMFEGCTSLTEISFISDTMRECDSMFKGCSSLVSIDLDDFKKVRYAVEMFKNCTSLTTITCTQNLAITNAGHMFEGCSSLESTTISFMASLYSAAAMFKDCTSLTEATIGNENNITNASSMFEGCTSLETADISSMTSLANATAMFKGCTSLTEVIK